MEQDQTEPETTETPEPTETPAEPEEDEQAAEEETEAPAEPPAEPLSEKEIQQRMGQLEKEATTHANRVSKIMGEDAQTLEPCPLCEPNIPGFFWPGAVDDDAKARTLHAIGLGVLNEYPDDPATETCDYCAGFGETRTGSKVAEQITRACPKCSAKGWLTADDKRTWESRQIASGAVVPGVPEPQSLAVSATPQMPPDQYGRPFGHANYGKSEAYLTPEERAADSYVPKG